MNICTILLHKLHALFGFTLAFKIRKTVLKLFNKDGKYYILKERGE